MNERKEVNLAYDKEKNMVLREIKILQEFTEEEFFGGIDNMRLAKSQHENQLKVFETNLAKTKKTIEETDLEIAKMKEMQEKYGLKKKEVVPEQKPEEGAPPVGATSPVPGQEAPKEEVKDEQPAKQG